MSNYKVEVTNLHVEKDKLPPLQEMFNQLNVIGGLLEVSVINQWQLIHTSPVVRVRIGFDTSNPDPITGEEQDFVEKLVELAVTEAMVTGKIAKRLDDGSLTGWAIHFNGKGHRVEQNLATMEVITRPR